MAQTPNQAPERLLFRLLDGDALSERESDALGKALDAPAARADLRRWLGFECCLQQGLGGDLTERAVAARERLLAEAFLRAKRGRARIASPDADAGATGSVARPRRSRRVLRVAALAAAVACVLIVGYKLFSGGYPAPSIEGSYRIVEGDGVGRGAVIETGAENAHLEIGGYCRVAVEPASVVRIEGEEANEKIVLEKGGVVCRVDSGQGAFAVVTGLGTVSVTGTEFTVRLIEGETPMKGKKLLVKVAVGSVLIATAWGNHALGQGAAIAVSAPVKEVAPLLRI